MLTAIDGITLQRTDYERLLLAAAWISPDYAKEKAGWFNPSLFRDKQIRKAWEMMMNGSSNMEAVIATDLHIDIMKWSGDVVTSLAVGEYARKITQLHYLFMMNNGLIDVYKLIAKGEVEKVQLLLDELASSKVVTGRTMRTAMDVGLDFESSLDHALPLTIPTGIPKIDATIGGLWEETLLVICARPSMGKTALMWQWMRNMAAADYKVAFFSLETSERLLWLRAACGALQISIRDYQSRQLTDEQVEMLRERSVNLREVFNSHLMIDASSTTTTADIWEKVAANKPDVVMIDHLRLLGDKGENETKRLGNITRRLKRIAKDFEIPVVLAAQLSRPSAKKGEIPSSPQLTDLRDSGEIEEDADLVLSIHRPDYYTPGASAQTSDTFLDVLKFRDGATARMNLVFHKQMMWFGVQSSFEDEDLGWPFDA